MSEISKQNRMEELAKKYSEKYRDRLTRPKEPPKAPASEPEKPQEAKSSEELLELQEETETRQETSPEPTSAEELKEPVAETEEKKDFGVGDYVKTTDSRFVSNIGKIAEVLSDNTGKKYYKLEGSNRLIAQEILQTPSEEEIKKIKIKVLSKAVRQAEKPPEAEGEPTELKQVVSEEVKDVFTKKLAGANLSAEERQRFEAIVNNKNLLDKAADFAATKLKGEKAFGIHLDAVASIAGGAGIRLALRNTLESLFALGTGVAGGAIVGGTFRGFREWRKAAKEAYSATSWLKELEGKDGLELARTHEVVSLAIQRAKVKGDEQEALELVLKLRDVETKIGLPREQGRPENAAEQLKKYLEVKRRVAGTTYLVGEREKLYQNLVRSRQKNIIKKFAKGALFGGVIGAAGGAVGSLVSEYFFGGGEMRAEDLVVAKSQAVRQVAEKAYDDLPKFPFTMNVRPGEGVTHAARNLIHDYLVEQHELMPGQELNPSREQLIYAEDYLRRKLEKSLEAGEEVYQAKGAEIMEAVNRARALGEGELANLRENWVGKVSEKTWTALTDYGHPTNPANDFAETIKEKALAVAQAIDRSVELESFKGEPLETVQDLERKDRFVNYIATSLVGAGAVAIGGASYAARLREQKILMETRAEKNTKFQNLTQELQRKYGIFARGEIPAGGGDPQALENLDKALGSLPKEIQDKLTGKRFKAARENMVGEDAVISFNLQTKPEALAKFIENNLPEVERLMRRNQTVIKIRQELQKKYGIQIHSYLYGDKQLSALESLEEALEDYTFEKKVRINLLAAEMSKPGEGVNLTVIMTPEAMEAEIAKYLKQQHDAQSAGTYK